MFENKNRQERKLDLLGFNTMKVIGRTDCVDLPELSLFDIKAKVDTGAYGCSLHCHRIKVDLSAGKKVLTFKVLDPSHPEYQGEVFLFEKFSEKNVRNSGGQTERRYTIKTPLILFNKKRIVEFSLTDRKKMRYPVLLGRKFLNKRFLVNVNLKDVSFQLKNENK